MDIEVSLEDLYVGSFIEVCVCVCVCVCVVCGGSVCGCVGRE